MFCGDETHHAVISDKARDADIHSLQRVHVGGGIKHRHICTLDALDGLLAQRRRIF